MSRTSVILFVALPLLALGGASPGLAAGKTAVINAISATGVGDKIGEVVITEAGKGLNFKVSATGLADGEHGFHIHEKADCGPGQKDGKPAAGVAAGGHFDPMSKKTHKGPDHTGHKGDLPKLTSASKKIAANFDVPDLTLADISGHALVIHEGGDNYSDTPENGGGLGRIACAVIK